MNLASPNPFPIYPSSESCKNKYPIVCVEEKWDLTVINVPSELSKEDQFAYILREIQPYLDKLYSIPYTTIEDKNNLDKTDADKILSCLSSEEKRWELAINWGKPHLKKYPGRVFFFNLKSGTKAIDFRVPDVDQANLELSNNPYRAFLGKAYVGTNELQRIEDYFYVSTFEPLSLRPSPAIYYECYAQDGSRRITQINEEMEGVKFFNRITEEVFKFVIRP